ncbi:hypothetical protein Tsubulata_031894 [Turnera subulata]|uniref:Protein kinase domain-containing protein n=1 Tax=Turnera subulata TaxID=218843 RepID=A0A9Q0JQG1_9ROSI|nr:hypothetical protein Tsubulata_031894 [Turnera subulata]
MNSAISHGGSEKHSSIHASASTVTAVFWLQQERLNSSIERASLLELRSSLGLRSRDWPRKADPCSIWRGVKCENGSVSDINISGFRRTRIGSQNPQFAVDALANLTNLRAFNASGFLLPGTIPDWFGQSLVSLQVLDLRSCSVRNAVPGSLGNLSSLVGLYLSDNNLTGLIPASLGQLAGLVELDLSRNLFTGSIPDSFGSLGNLTRLDVSSNVLSGGIPLGIGRLAKLRYLNLSNNDLSSQIPPQLGDLSSLVDLDLSFNSLSGSLPAELRGMRNLQRMLIGNNALDGSLPANLFPVSSQLQVVVLKHNGLAGAVPGVLWSIPGLVLLDISANNFTGMLNASLSANSTSAALNVSGNLFYGGLMPMLRRFAPVDLSGNYFEGKVPDYVGNNATLASNCLQNVSNQRSLTDCSSFYSERGLAFDNFGLPNSTQSPPPAKENSGKSNRKVIILASVLGGVGLIFLLTSLLVLLVCCRKRGTTTQRGVGVGPVPAVSSPAPPGVSINLSSLGDSFTYQQLLQATGDFGEANLIKNGHSGDLYRGILENGIPIVIKKVDLQSIKKESYMAELDFFSKVSHSRLVPLLGHCLENETEKFLVYKYMPNGDLSNSLYKKTSEEDDSLQSLDWITRLKIAIGAAEGSLTATCAYDVFCFGKVLLELVTGKLGISASSDAQLKEWLDQMLPYISIYDKELVIKIVDPSLIIDEDLLEEVWAMAIVARSCLNPKPSRRPLMRYILKALENPLKVVREENSGSARLRTTSSRSSWNAALFGSWRSSSDVAGVPPASGARPEGGSSFKHSATSNSQGSGQNGWGEHSSSHRRHSREICPEPSDAQDQGSHLSAGLLVSRSSAHEPSNQPTMLSCPYHHPSLHHHHHHRRNPISAAVFNSLQQPNNQQHQPPQNHNIPRTQNSKSTSFLLRHLNPQPQNSPPQPPKFDHVIPSFDTAKLLEMSLVSTKRVPQFPGSVTPHPTTLNSLFQARTNDGVEDDEETEAMILKAVEIRRKVTAQVFREFMMKKGKFGITYSTNVVSRLGGFLDLVVIKAAALKCSPEFESLRFNDRAKVVIEESGVVPLIRWLKHNHLSYNKITKLISMSRGEIESIQRLADWLKTNHVKGEFLGTVMIRAGDGILQRSYEELNEIVGYLESNGVRKDWMGYVIRRCPQLLGFSMEELRTRVGFFLDMGMNEKDFGTMVFDFPRVLGYFTLQEMKDKVNYLMEFGLSIEEVGKLLAFRPELMACSIEERWKPLVKYLYYLGISREGMKRMLVVKPMIFCFDMESNLVAKDIGIQDDAIGNMLVKFPPLLTYSLYKKIRPVVIFLMVKAGVTESDIAKVIASGPELLGCSITKKLEINRRYFLSLGIRVRELGRMIADFPMLLRYSVDSFRPKYQYFRRSMIRPLHDVIEFPRFFSYSLEDRIIPRHKVLVENRVTFKLRYMLGCSDEEFEKKVADAVERRKRFEAKTTEGRALDNSQADDNSETEESISFPDND